MSPTSGSSVQPSTSSKHPTSCTGSQARKRRRSHHLEPSQKKAKADEPTMKLKSTFTTQCSKKRPGAPVLETPSKKVKIDPVCWTIFKSVLWCWQMVLKWSEDIHILFLPSQGPSVVELTDLPSGLNKPAAAVKRPIKLQLLRYSTQLWTAVYTSSLSYPVMCLVWQTSSCTAFMLRFMEGLL